MNRYARVVRCLLIQGGNVSVPDAKLSSVARKQNGKAGNDEYLIHVCKAAPGSTGACVVSGESLLFEGGRSGRCVSGYWCILDVLFTLSAYCNPGVAGGPAVGAIV